MDRKELEDLIRSYSMSYSAGTPEVTDAEFDSLVEQLSEIAPDSDVLLEVGSAPSYGKKIKHEVPMGSLNKTKTLEEVDKWKKSTNAKDFVWSEKIDGCSGELVYEKGKLVQASTRGNGTIGSLITDNILNTDIIKKLPTKERVVVRGEFFISKSHFNLFFASEAANARNFVSGSIQLKEPSEIIGRGVEFKAFRVLEPKCQTLIDEVAFAKSLGFSVVTLHNSIPDESIIEDYQDTKRVSLDYEIDGLVIQVNNNLQRESLGFNGFNSKGAIAFKFKPETIPAEVLDIEWNLGRSGRVTPVAILNPVTLAGSVVARVTLHNHREMDEMGVAPGCIVSLRKGGDIIPDIEKVLEKSDKKAEHPTKCPCCGMQLKNDGVFYTCTNDDCGDKLVQSILHWLRVCDTKEVGEFLVTSLISAGKIKSLPDIFKITNTDFFGIEGVGPTTINTWKKVIDSTRRVDLDIFLRGLNMESIGKTVSKQLAKKFETVERVFSATKKDILLLDGFADVSSTKVINELARRKGLKEEMMKYVKVDDCVSMVGKFTGKKFSFTGSCSMGRKEMEGIILERGGEVCSPGKSTNFVIAGEGAVSTKLDKVIKGGGRVIDEVEFLKMIEN